MRLYHGSENIIENPEFGKGKTTNDYGRGFYCTESLDLAREWACGSDHNGFANAYEFDTTGLKVLKLNESPYNILIANAISLRKLSEAMRLGKLGEQVVLKSRRAFDQIRFVGYEEVRAEIYYPRKSKRDRMARREYRRSLNESDSENDLYMVDIMREKMENGDSRLQSGLFK